MAADKSRRDALARKGQVVGVDHAPLRGESRFGFFLRHESLPIARCKHERIKKTKERAVHICYFSFQMKRFLLSALLPYHQKKILSSVGFMEPSALDISTLQHYNYYCNVINYECDSHKAAEDS